MKPDFENFKWQPIIENVTDILRITTCIIDTNGVPIIIPSEGRYGWRFIPQLLDVQVNYNQIAEDRFEFVDKFRLHHYAIPFKSSNNTVKGYILLGPMILNKRLAMHEYYEIAQKWGEDFDGFKERLEEIRVISQLNLEHILNTVVSFIQFRQNQVSLEFVRPENTRIQNIFQSMLTLSLAIANAESGSVMLFNHQTNELSIQAAKGLSNQYLNSRIKLNDGVAGVAFKENKTMLIHGKPQNSRIAHLLKRTEIKQSIVMPFGATDQKTRGVLNLNIIKANKDIRSNLNAVNNALERIIIDVLKVI